MKRMSVAIDMDNVMSDDESYLVDLYKKDYGVSLDMVDLMGKTEKEALPDKDAVERYYQTPGFFRNLPVMEAAIEGVKALIEKYEVYIVSAAFDYPHSLTEKYDWLQANFRFLNQKNIVFCGNKSIIDTDYMIDDKVENLQACKAKGLLFTACHNVDTGYENRVNNWVEVVKELTE